MRPTAAPTLSVVRVPPVCRAQFKLMWAIKDRFPLHYIVFKQTASHIPHEANVERLFSRAGLLSDPNMDPHYLAILTAIGVNKKAYKPTWQEIKAKYYAMFRGKNAATASNEDCATPRKSPMSASPPPRKSPRLSGAK